jgi:hypothetical protein
LAGSPLLAQSRTPTKGITAIGFDRVHASLSASNRAPSNRSAATFSELRSWYRQLSAAASKLVGTPFIRAFPFVNSGFAFVQYPRMRGVIASL